MCFQFVNARPETAAEILTSNRGLAELDEVLGDRVVAAAVLDRFLHYAAIVQIEGTSYSHPSVCPNQRTHLNAAIQRKARWQVAKNRKIETT